MSLISLRLNIDRAVVLHTDAYRGAHDVRTDFILSLQYFVAVAVRAGSGMKDEVSFWHI